MGVLAGLLWGSELPLLLLCRRGCRILVKFDDIDVYLIYINAYLMDIDAIGIGDGGGVGAGVGVVVVKREWRRG